MPNNHGIKRPPTYVPQEAARLLERLSKADLMELAWDVALINTGYADNASPAETLDVLADSHEALRANGWQSTARLKRLH